MENSEQPLLRKGYLVILVLAAGVLLLLNPGVLHIRGCRRDKEPVPDATPSVPVDGELTGLRSEIDELRRWLRHVPEAQISIERRTRFTIEKLDPNPPRESLVRFSVSQRGDRDPLSASDLHSALKLHSSPAGNVKGVIKGLEAFNNPTGFVVSVRVSGRGQVGLSVENCPPEYYEVNRHTLWVVPISGTSLSREGWIAAAGSNILRVGDDIAPSPRLCGYRVLSISRRCVWLAAYYDEQDRDRLPPIRWPDIAGVLMSSGKNPEPAMLKLRQGTFLRPGGGIRFKRTQSRLILDRLWDHAVHFRYESRDNGRMYNLLCVIVRS